MPRVIAILCLALVACRVEAQLATVADKKGNSKAAVVKASPKSDAKAKVVEAKVNSKTVSTGVKAKVADAKVESKTVSAAVKAKVADVKVDSKKVVANVKAKVVDAKVSSKKDVLTAKVADTKASSKTVKDSKANSKTKSLIHGKSAINPRLKDVSSDKKFFGPPFPADYVDDKRPTVSPSIAWQLKEENKPYPYLQGHKEFDKDFVKDENSDKGDWKAQFDYDAYRRKLVEEEAAVKKAQEAAERAGKKASEAEKAANEAGQTEKTAKEALDEAVGKENAAAAGSGTGGGAGGADGSGSDSGGDGMTAAEKEALENMRNKVSEAAAKYEKEKKDFEECKKKLAEAKQRVADIKQQLADYDVKLAAQTQLHIQQKESKKKAKQAKIEAAEVKVKAAEEKFEKLDSIRVQKDTVLARVKADNRVAQANLLKHKKSHEEAKKFLEFARLRLQKLRGVKIAPPTKSGASLAGGVSVLVLASALAATLA